MNSREGWLTGVFSGNLLHTTDGGKTWRDFPLPKKIMKLSYVYFESPSEGWFVNVFGPPSDSGIYHTINGGNTWMHLSRPVVSSGLDTGGSNPIPAKWKAGRFLQMIYAK